MNAQINSEDGFNRREPLSDALPAPARDDEGKLTIEGYTDQLSVKAGDQIGFHISTSAEMYSIEIARVGAERGVVWTGRGWKVSSTRSQRMPRRTAVTGQWP